MFDRGKRDDAPGQGAETRPAETQPAEPHRSYQAASAKPADRGSETAVIGRSIQIEGAVRGNEDLRIEGDVSGTVELQDSSLTIGREGKVRADIYAKAIIVDGLTEGDLYATDRIVVHVNAQVRGNITAPKVAVEEGATFKGSIEMDQAAVEKAFNKANLQSGSRPTGAAQPGAAQPGAAQPGRNAEAKSPSKPEHRDRDKDPGPAAPPSSGAK
jgi:cytoskeletal protein CcmA (bactofilin family)